jgi:hypothetical protein
MQRSSYAQIVSNSNALLLLLPLLLQLLLP